MTNEDKQIEGFAISGAEVSQLTDKHFVICAEPFYRKTQDFKNPEEKKNSLVIPVNLSNGTTAEWYANKKSQAKILAAKGRNLKDWIGFSGEWVVKEQVVGKEERLVIYIK